MSPATKSPRETQAILLVMAIAFCAFIDLYATQAILPTLVKLFHTTKVGVGMTVSASTLAVALLAPIVGSVADAFERKRLILFGIVGLALTTFLAATSATLPVLIIWRFLQGAFVSILYVVTITYINEAWAGKGVGAAMAAFVGGTAFGGFSGRFISGLVTAWLNWHWAFITLGCLNILGALAVWTLMPRTPKAEKAKRGRFSPRDITTRPLLAAYLVGFNVLFSLVGSFTYVNFRLAAPPFLLGPAALGSIFAVYLAGSVVTPLIGKWIDRLGNRTMVAIALSCSAFGELLTLLPYLVAVILGLAFISTGVFITQASSTSFVGLAAGKNKSAAAGLYASSYYIGGTVGGILPGFLWPIGGWPACVALFITIQLITVTLAMVFWRLEKSRPGLQRLHGLTGSLA